MVRQGWKGHSRDDGYPQAAMRIPGVRRLGTAYGVIEPLICFFTGTAIALAADYLHAPWLYGVAGWIFLGFFSLGFQYWVSEAVTRRRVMALRDAELEQQEIVR